ncbi:hypothetical protein POM88_046112 [Heracleum sosnowskyi]|uniref:Uncharacterized protein n=1 Tax=Heracleum sosnowskyi TaxID=360622 RepID=A0AAD8M732_9APIA|nr:hypothetical protein POM88_046112 [Heracleum sosnowskyi]
MDFSWNQFSGNIPATIGGAPSLNYLSLSHNKLEGPIPQSLGSLKGLEFLDMSNNNLSGKIPKPLESLRYLRYFNISFSKLEGEVPTGGPFLNFTDQSYLQNDGICGAPRFKVRPCQTSTTQQSGSRNIAFLKFTLPLIVAATLLLGIAIFMKRSGNKKIRLTQEDTLLCALRRLAMDCSRNSPVERIDMEDVLNRLYKIKTLFLEQCHDIDTEVNNYVV